MATHWYAIQSKPKQEERVEKNLRAWKIDTLLPKLVLLGRSGNGSCARIGAMFPGYLFARFDACDMLAKIRYTRGVSKILGTGDGPTPVGVSVIEAISARMDPSGLVRLTSSLRPGDPVRVIGGPFKDFLGVFEQSATAAQRVTLLLSTLNAQVRLAIDAHLVERVN